MISRWKIDKRTGYANWRNYRGYCNSASGCTSERQKHTLAYVHSPLASARTTRPEWLCKYYMILQFTGEPCAFVWTGSGTLAVSRIIVVKSWFNYETLETSSLSEFKKSWLRNEGEQPLLRERCHQFSSDFILWETFRKSLLTQRENNLLASSESSLYEAKRIVSKYRESFRIFVCSFISPSVCYRLTIIKLFAFGIIHCLVVFKVYFNLLKFVD